jgi:maltose O-acetyltransferase
VLGHAWSTRARAEVGSAWWLRLWARRAVHAPSLLRLHRSVRSLRRAGADIGDFVVIGAATITGPPDQLSVGDGTAIDQATLRLRGRIEIGRSVAMIPGGSLLAGTLDAQSPTWELVAQDIVIEDHAWIGTNAIIFGGCRVGAGAVVSAGAVVGKDVPPGVIVLGNPARAVGAREVEAFDYSPAERWPMWRAWRGLRFEDQMRADPG